MVRGDVRADLSPMGKFEARDVRGVQVDTAFVEYQPYDCSLLQGYNGSGVAPAQTAQTSLRLRRFARAFMG